MRGESLTGAYSGPVVFGDRLYLQNTSAAGEMEQERLMCFNADTGKLLWEHRYNMFTSDVPPHRLAWASPVVDPATGNVFAISGNGLTMSLNKDGKLLWERSLAEEYGIWTTHGGRMSTPIIDGDQLIVSGLVFGWGQTASPAHRFISLDKATGHTIWVGAPEGGPTDTIYANPYVADVNGVRMFFSGGSDGAMHALKIATGEPMWHWDLSKRGLNTAALMIGSDLIVTHSEENIATSEMGMLAAVPAASKGTLTDKDAKWITRDVQAGYGLPVSDGERIYLVDNGGILFAFDVKTGKQLWTEKLGNAREILTRPRRRQAVCRHREREVLHHPAASRQSRDPRQRSARDGGQPGGDHRVPRGRARPCLRRVDGRALCDRTEGDAAADQQRRSRGSGRSRHVGDDTSGSAAASARRHPPPHAHGFPILKPGESDDAEHQGVR